VKEDTWQKRICIFWYIVLVDLALHFFLSNTDLPAVLVLTALRSLHGSDLSFLGQADLDSIVFGIRLWLNIAIRVFEFGVMLHWLGRPAGSILSEFGLNRESAGRGVIAGLVVSLVLGGGFFLWQFILSRCCDFSLVHKLGLSGKKLYEQTMFYQISYVFAGGLSAAFFEDIIFVGLLFGALRKRFGLLAAFALALGHFVAAHAVMNLLLAADISAPSRILGPENLRQFVIWTLGGSIFLTLYAVFRTLIPSMIFHCVGNLLIFFTGFWFE
jgi:membrane protease YdiL (CAAX protease family)